ncbi:MAG: DUF2793 domain-containing protein [Paracoccaceae bacterium]|jgi:hypothetical protein|nr:DUF2793 domain-containing protein [Paracoccaceae bacterium]
MTTPNLALPLLAAAQAQKHITVNEALALLDGLVQLVVRDRDLTTPPASPAEGDRYIVAAGATGAWAGWDGDVALFTGGAWLRLAPQEGWRVWVEDEGVLVVHVSGAWLTLDAALGLLKRGPAVEVARGPGGSSIGLHVEEELLSGLSGASVASTIAIPDRAIVLAVSTRTVAVVLGATSYDCGIAGEPAKFGGSLGVAAGSTNVGAIGPQAFYADTPVVLTANGGDFTGGDVRIAIQYLLPTAPAA